jgi:hypothetical protein
MSLVLLGIRTLARDILSAARPPTRLGAPERIRRREVPYWQERGWRREGETYVGSYQTPFGSFRGLIEDRGWGHVRFYLRDAPEEVRRSGHWACFQPRLGKGYHVHMARAPQDVSSGIITIERLITEAFHG